MSDNIGNVSDGWNIKQLGLVSGDRLPIIANIRVGEKIDDPNPKTASRPRALDHFKVFSPDLDAKKRRIVHREITAWLEDLEGERPRRFPIMFLHNETFDEAGNLMPSDNYIQYMGLYAGRKCVCRGDGGQAGGERGDAIVMQDTVGKNGKTYKAGTRLTGKCPCAKYDPEKNGGECKPHTVVGGIARAADGTTPIMTSGGIVVFRSGGIMTATEIKSGFNRFARLTQGFMAYLPFYLVVQMRPGSHGNVPVVHLESPLTEDQLIAVAQQRAMKQLTQDNEFRRIHLAAKDVLLLESPATQADVNAEFSPDTVTDAVVLDIEPDATLEPEQPVDEPGLTDEEIHMTDDEFFGNNNGGNEELPL